MATTPAILICLCGFLTFTDATYPSSTEYCSSSDDTTCQEGSLSEVPISEKKRMSIKLYIWKPRNDSVGHASMTLSDGETHISWWPTNMELKKIGNVISDVTSKANPSPSLVEDIKREHGVQQDETYSLPNDKINEDAIKTWWKDFSPNEMYRVRDQNCCHVVFKALEVGDKSGFFQDEDVKGFGKTLLTPLDIKSLLEAYQNSLIKDNTNA